MKTGRTNDDLATGKAGPKTAPARWEPPTDAELAALDALGRNGEWQFGGRRLRLTNLDKVLFPPRPGEEPVTKRDFIRYHALIAPTMLPYLVARPVNLHRYPNGADKPGFWHKAVPGHAPEWLSRWRNEEADPGETECYLVIDSPPALVWVANYGALELHPWTSTVRDPHAPTWALIDLDPGEKTAWDDLLLLARLHRTALEHLGVQSRPKVTGKRGIQIWVPVTEGRYTFDDTRAWVESLSRTMDPDGGALPELRRGGPLAGSPRRSSAGRCGSPSWPSGSWPSGRKSGAGAPQPGAGSTTGSMAVRSFRTTQRWPAPGASRPPPPNGEGVLVPRTTCGGRLLHPTPAAAGHAQPKGLRRLPAGRA